MRTTIATHEHLPGGVGQWRSQRYARGVSEAGWHLLHNLTLSLEEYLLQKRPVLRKAAAPEAAPEEKDDVDEFASGPIMPNRPRTHDRKIEEAARKRYERLVEQWKNIRRLYLAGTDLRDICRQLGISARTVYRQPEKPAPAHLQGRALSVSPGARQNRLALRICVTGPAEIRSSDESPGASPRRPERIVTPATRPSRDPGGLTRRRSP